MELHERVDQIKSRQDLVEFISALRDDLEGNPDGWENPALPDYLEALAERVQHMDQAFKNQGVEFSEQQPWRLFGEMLFAAKFYE
jgi:hypothetical protein